MGAPAQPERTSLDRLKALDSLPDLDAQLAEAGSLCNHAARAEMITKWLLAKLKSQDEARKHGGCWTLLSDCCRLLSPHKTAILLSTNGLLDILQTTLSASELTASGLAAIGQTLHLLFEIGQSPQGAAVKSFLSTASNTAATICGIWLHNVYSMTENPQIDARSITLYLHTDAFLQLWTSRKPSAQDDELFDSSCLVNALLLISRLRGYEALDSSKRKRGGASASIPRERVEALERLIAKHTILPARTAFFKIRQPQAKKPRNKTPAEDPQSIKERLGSLKMAIWSDPNRDALRTVPLVLDIALRSKSAPTPRDRLYERPWIEELWAALCGCFSNQKRAAKNDTLADLFQVLRQQGTTLSHQLLSDIVKEDAMPADDTSDLVDWQLVARIVDLDAAVFNDRALAQNLFDLITTASSSTRTEGDSTLDIRNDIVVPIMESYGRSRSLRTFMDLWDEQLQQEQNFRPQSIWNDISSSFADLVEEALPQPQILSFVHEKFSSLRETAALSIPTLNTTLVILEALLRGVRADSTISTLHDELDSLIRDMFTIVELETFDVHKDIPVQLWRLLARVVTMWYPLWASKQHDQSAIGDRGAALMARKTFKIALSQGTMTGKASDSDKLIVGAAQTFVGAMCGFFKDVAHDQCRALCVEAIHTLSKQNLLALDTLIGQPTILSAVESGSRKALFSGVSQDVDDSRDADQIEALIAASRSNDSREALNDIFAVLKKRAKHQAGPSNRIIQTPLQSIASVSLSRAQRIELLDIIINMDDAEADEVPDRLAMMLELASPPCLEAKLFDHASSLWEISSSLSTDEDFPIGLTATVILLEELVSCVVKAWLATHQRQRSRELLGEFSAKLSEHMKRISSRQNRLSAGKIAEIAVVKTAVTILESENAAAVSKELLHRDSKHMKAYIKGVLENADAILTLVEQEEHKLADSSAATSLDIVLEALADVPESVWQLSGQSATKASAIAHRAAAVLDVQRADESTLDMSGRMATTGYRVACRYLHEDPMQVTRLAQKALQHKLDAVDYREVLAQYDATMKRFDHDKKLQALSHFKVESSLSSVHSLALQRVVLHSFTVEDIEANKASLTAAFHDILEGASITHDEHIQKAALVTIAEMAKEKSSAINQYAVERTISTLVQLLRSSSNTTAIYAPICNVLSTFFAHHRSRLQGRYHLVVALLQTLTSSLFHTKSTTTTNNTASLRHARLLSKLLETFCNPPQARHNKKSTHLVDEARKAQAHAGQFAQYILHHYCAQILTGTLGEGVRDALSPGLWAVIEAIEVNNEEGIKSLSSAMNNSERAVLRSVYEDWKRFGKWEGT